MSITVHWFMNCDACGYSTEDYGVGGHADKSAKNIRAATKADGWKRIHGKDICSECAKQPQGRR